MAETPRQDGINNIEALTFEQAYTQLEDIVNQLETGELSLDESVALYARGQALARHCGMLLDAADLRIEQIEADGSLHDVP